MYKWMLLHRVQSNLKMDDGEGAGGGTGDNPSTNPETNNNPDPDDKTFTQEQVNSMIASEKRKNFSAVYKGLGFESEEQAKEFINKYKQEEEKNKSDLVKEQEKTKQLEAEKKAEQEKAQTMEYKFEAMKEGCSAESAEDVVVLVKSKMSDDKDFATALKEVKEHYPSMFGQESSGKSTGGGGTSPRGRVGREDISGMGKRLAEQRRKNNTANNDTYFK